MSIIPQKSENQLKLLGSTKGIIMTEHIAPPVQEESPNLGKLYEALAKAQLEMQPAKTSSNNPFFKSKYADLAEVVRASRSALAKNGLAVMQYVKATEEGKSLLCTRLGHTSGQWIESSIPIRSEKPGIQGFGSNLSYLRRYMYGALVGVVSSGEDDDGEMAMSGVKRA
jgi:hypothetical protein